MIDRNMINPQRLLDILLNDCAGNINKWWNQVEFVKDYMPRHPRPDTIPAGCVIQCGSNLLRDLGRGVFIWDIGYNNEENDFLSPEQALLALRNAPVPPWLLKPVVWGRKDEG
jgi:hypothetical protein